MSNSSNVDGTHLMYHYLQKSLQDEDSVLFQQIVSRLIIRLGIWFPPAIYKILPIALPHVVRDPSCRGAGEDDQWSSPNAQGYVRDDNTLVKSLVRSFNIQSSVFPQYAGKRLGRGFVAAHVWSRTIDGRFTTRQAITNSFLPNLVWLPANVAKLTDRRDSFAEMFIQALATKIYQGIDIHDQLRPFALGAWSMLRSDNNVPVDLPEVSELNFFEVPDRFVATRLRIIRTASIGLKCVEEHRPLHAKKVLHTRYTMGLPSVHPDNARALRIHLEEYYGGVTAALADAQARASI